MRIAMLNNKGGVGKTLTTVCLAEAFALFGRRVLVVDMDPQANATSALAVTPDERYTLADCLSGNVANGAVEPFLENCGWDADDLHRATGIDVAGLIDVAPASLALEDITMQAGMPGSHMRLRRALYGVDDKYDVTLIDCPPSMGHLTANALAALDDCDDGGDTAVVVTTPTKQAYAGALRAQQFVRMYAADLGVCAEITGMIVNQVRGTRRHGERLDQVAQTFPDVPVLGSPISLRADIARIVDDEQPMSLDKSPEVLAARETFAAIATSLLNRIKE